MGEWKDQLEPWKNQLEQWLHLHEAIEYLNQTPPPHFYYMLLLLSCSFLLSCFCPSACSNARNLVPSYSPALAEVPNESTFVLHPDSNKKQKAKIVRLVDVHR
ncbi:hypothetical protein GQ457_07G012010 [Hibiscus cannabinus]